MNKLLLFWAIVFFTNALFTTVVFALNYYFIIASNGPSTYQFGYDTPQENGAPRLMREEGRMADGTVIGRYGYTDPFGVFRVVKYAAGPNGYYAFEDIGGDSSSSPLFFKATASQKELSVSEPEKSSPHSIATKFDPPLYHPEAHLAETPKISDLDPDFRKLVFNAQQPTHIHSTQSLNVTVKDELNDRRASVELPIKRSTVGERNTAFDFDDDLGIPPKVSSNQRDGDILKELESIRITSKPKPVNERIPPVSQRLQPVNQRIQSVNQRIQPVNQRIQIATQQTPTVNPTPKSSPFQRQSWILPDKQTTFRPQLNKEEQLFAKLKNDEQYKKVTFKPEPNIYPNDRRFSILALNRKAHTTPPPPTTYLNTFITRNRNEHNEYHSTTQTTVAEAEGSTFETVTLPPTTSKVNLVYKNPKPIESNDKINTTLLPAILVNTSAPGEPEDSSSSYGERLSSDENIQSLKSIFSSFLKRSSTEKQLKDPSIIRHRFIETTTAPINSSDDDLIGIESIKNKTSFEFPEKRFTRKQGFNDKVTIKHITTTETPTTNTPFTLPSIYYYDNKEFEQSLPVGYDVTNYPLSSYLNSATQSDNHPVYRKPTTTESTRSFKEINDSPTPVYKPAFRFLDNFDSKTNKANELNGSELSSNEEVKSEVNSSTAINEINNLNESIEINLNQTEIKSENKINPLNDWSSRESISSNSDTDFNDDTKTDITSPENGKNSKKKIIKVLLRKGEAKQSGHQASDFKFDRTSKVVKLNLNSNSSNLLNITKSGDEMTAHKTEIKRVISENRSGLRTDHLNNLKQAGLYVAPIGLYKSNERPVSEYNTHSATTKVNFYVPPIPVIHNTYNFGRLLEPEINSR